VPLVVHGMQNLQRALKQADRDTRLGVRRELSGVAEPIRRDVETLARARIRRMPRSPQWAEMRVGVTQKLVYVAPRQRGRRRGDDPAKRRKLAPLMITRAMDPALQHNGPAVRRDFEQMLGRMAARFNRS
jgi:hypothetical protein